MVEQASHPRSLRAKDSVLCATKDLLDEGGLGAATVDAISARSGVSKATIYKHWPCRTAIAAEAFGRRMADSSRGMLTGFVRYAEKPARCARSTSSWVP